MYRDIVSITKVVLPHIYSLTFKTKQKETSHNESRCSKFKFSDI